MADASNIPEPSYGPIVSDPSELRSAYRKKNSRFVAESIHPADVARYEAQGWEVQKKWPTKTRMKRGKSHNVSLEDKTWCLFHRMGYPELNGKNFKITFNRPDGSVGEKQIDVFAKDNETIFIIECKSRETSGTRNLQKDIQETVSLQNPFRTALYKFYGKGNKPKIVWAYATYNIRWSPADVTRAASNNIEIITENELFYYDAFIKYIGPAGKYQIISEFLKDQKIPRLSDVKLPAIRGKIGGYIFYYFVTTPRQLLKISFVNHQALNHPDGKPAYQRMISAGRIKKIGKFIENGGFFPTNLLVNFVDKPKFDFIEPNIRGCPR